MYKIVKIKKFDDILEYITLNKFKINKYNIRFKVIGNMDNFFSNKIITYSLKNIIENLDTSEVTSMNSIFENAIIRCPIDISKWDTSNIVKI